MDNLEIITTEDGSHSLIHRELNETYHSRHGAIQESNHVFIKNGLDYMVEKFNPARVRILEIGFGTGLNVFLTFQRTSNIPISITSIEKFPLHSSLWEELNYTTHYESEGKAIFEKIHQCPWNEEIKLSTVCSFRKIEASLEDIVFTSSFDVIYFDAFAPNKQPEMWSMEMLKKITDAMATPSVFVTYCAKGQLKRDLRSLGLVVESPEGPPGKKEMTRATKPHEFSKF